jgi:hypothetical protein
MIRRADARSAPRLHNSVPALGNRSPLKRWERADGRAHQRRARLRRAHPTAWSSPARAGSRSSSRPTAAFHAVDGIVTGWHEPVARMLTAIAAEDTIERSYAAAVEHGYLWYEFGDSHLNLR